MELQAICVLMESAASSAVVQSQEYSQDCMLF